MQGFRVFFVFTTFLFSLLSVANEWLPEDFATQPISGDEAEILFSLLENKNYLNFSSLENGCFQREFEMSRVIVQEGFEPLRVWVFGNLLVKNRKKQIKWSKHIAPALFVNRSGTLRVEVLDPALAKKPIEIRAWMNLFSNNCKDITKELFFSSEATSYEESVGCYFIIEKRILSDLKDEEKIRNNFSSLNWCN